MRDYLKEANEIFNEIVEIRRDIHRHPELGMKEFRTSQLIKDKLAEYGVDTIESPTPTSVVATIKGNRGEGKCVAIRTDIDALPVQEETGLPFASEVPNVMHACGHDVHCSMMLGNAKLLCESRDEFAGTVKLIFQHSEDTRPGGARELVGLGVMDGVDAIFGMHNSPSENDKVGVVAFREGPMTSSGDDFHFTIIGVGGHGSQPHKVPDPILTAAEMIIMFERVQSREVAPLDTAIFMMNHIEGGKVPNIIADRVKMSGNARSYTKEARAQMLSNAKRVAEAEEILSGCKIEFNPDLGYDACYNDEDLTAFLFEELPKVVGADHVENMKDPMGFSEDYSYFSTLTGVPSVFMILYGGHEGEELRVLHNAGYTIKEEAMPYGMAAMTGAAVAFLNRA